jgi:hypothetical protein
VTAPALSVRSRKNESRSATNCFSALSKSASLNRKEARVPAEGSGRIVRLLLLLLPSKDLMDLCASSESLDSVWYELRFECREVGRGDSSMDDTSCSASLSSSMVSSTPFV